VADATLHTQVDPPAERGSARHGADLPPGSVVGDYEIVRKVGHGGMGSVYEAIHPVIEKRVAIKVLLPELSKNEEAVERFKSEARAVNRIRHPAIVDVFGYGTTEDGRCFLVMELLDGESLGRRLQYDMPTVAEACDILVAITHALDAAHATGIVHRDLKPDNVFLVEHKHVKLLDFGIAKLSARDDGPAATDFTQPGQAMGTPRYIAPEQARGDAVDGRSDIYSLGVMAFELLVGRLPFVSDNPMELIAKHITLPPPTPSDLEPSLPPAADRLLLQMLDKQPANRPSLGEIRALLDEIRAPWVTALNDPPVRASRPVIEPPAITPPAPRRAWVPFALVAGVAGAAIVAFVVVRSTRPDAVAPPVVQPAAPAPLERAPAVEVTPQPPPPDPEVTPAPVVAPEPAGRPERKQVTRPRPQAPRAPVRPATPVTPPVTPAPPPPPVESPAPPPPTVDTTRDSLKRPPILNKP